MGGINFNPLFLETLVTPPFIRQIKLLSGFINAQKSLYKRDATGKIVFKHICLQYLENLPQ